MSMSNMDKTIPKFIDECMDGTFGYENDDGYVRILNMPRASGGRLVMRHRYFWELFVGLIPNGMELDHLCKNRRCFNPKHLRLIERKDHAVITNRERYADMISFGMDLLRAGTSVGEVSEMTNRTESCVRLWKQRLSNA